MAAGHKEMNLEQDRRDRIGQDSGRLFTQPVVVALVVVDHRSDVWHQLAPFFHGFPRRRGVLVCRTATGPIFLNLFFHLQFVELVFFFVYRVIDAKVENRVVSCRVERRRNSKSPVSSQREIGSIRDLLEAYRAVWGARRESLLLRQLLPCASG